MRYLLLTLPLALAACDTLPGTFSPAEEAQSISILGRQWSVAQIQEDPDTYRAIRDQSQYFLFGPPARTKTAQAIAALEGATGCKVFRSTLHRNISDHFISQMSCPAAPAAN